MTHQFNMLFRPLITFSLSLFFGPSRGGVPVMTCLFAYGLIFIRRSEKSSSMLSIYCSWMLNLNSIPAIVLSASMFSFYWLRLFLFIFNVYVTAWNMSVSSRNWFYAKEPCVCVRMAKLCAQSLWCKFHLPFDQKNLWADRLRGKNPIITLPTKEKKTIWLKWYDWDNMAFGNSMRSPLYLILFSFFFALPYQFKYLILFYVFDYRQADIVSLV